MSTPNNQTLAPCGTYKAKARHKRRGETCQTCGPIKPHSPAPCGTINARARHRRRGETCPNCPPHKPTKAECGTYQALRRHRRNNETCETCETAAEIRSETRNPMPAEDFIQEITFLLNAGEGTQRILTALGYAGREESFRDRLAKYSRQDLANRVLKPWDLAA